MTNNVIADTVLEKSQKSKPFFFSLASSSFNQPFEISTWDRVGVNSDDCFIILSENDGPAIIDDGLWSTNLVDEKNLFRLFCIRSDEKSSPLFPLKRSTIGKYDVLSWGGVYNLRYGQQEKMNSFGLSESLAETYLRQMAERLEGLKSRRKVSGITLLILGGGSVALGIGMTVEGDVPLAGPLMMIGIGGLAGGAGIWNLVSVSRAERKLSEVQSISNPEQREKVAHNALASLAAGGRTIRIIAITISAIGCAVGLFAKEERITIYGKEEKPLYLYAGIFAGLTAYGLIWRTPEEKVYRDYLEERKRQKELALRIGIGPYGGVRIGLALSF